MASEREQVLEQLEILAPLRWAEPWDNVGLLIDPVGKTSFARALLTIEFEEAVLEEALRHDVDLVISYHPPIFAGFKRLGRAVASERVVVDAVRAGLTVYSPHTALDAANPGMTDWLAGALGPGQSTPIVPKPDDARVGAGRIVQLLQPIALEEALERVKAHLQLSHLRLSRSPSGPERISTLAVCPGAGGSLFEQVADVDLLLTGEMRHHDVLGRKTRGCHVVLTDHTNSERGYLPLFATRLRAACPGLQVLVSSRDADPLRVV